MSPPDTRTAAPPGTAAAQCQVAARVTDTPSLAPAEARRLGELERVVDAGIETFLQVATALLEVKESRLYRGTHSTFDTYVKDRFGFGRAHAYRLLAAATVVEAMSPVGDITSERQARELVGLDPEIATEVFVTAKSAAAHRGDLAPTGTDLKVARTAIISTTSAATVAPGPRRRSPLPDSYWHAVYDLEKAVEKVKRLHEDDRFLDNRLALDRHRIQVSNTAALLDAIENDLNGLRCDCGGRIPINADFSVRCGVCE